jgi:hypothetical protein
VRNIIRIMAAVALAVSVAGIGGAAAAAPAASITGYVHAVNGTPINEAHVVAYDNATWEQVGEGYAGPDGSYSITIGTGTGTYWVKAQAMGYAAEYYDNVSDPAAVTTVTVAAESDTKGINFTLTQIGFISGAVFEASGVTLIPTARIVAYDSATGNWVNESDSRASAGCYYINLPPGTYRLKAEAAGYLSEWYANVTSFGTATPVAIVGPDENPDINFTLGTTLRVTTGPATHLTTTSARLNGNLTSMGASKDVTVSLEWGITAGGPYPNSAADQVRTTIGAISFYLSGLTPGTTYYYRARVDDDGGPVYGEEKSFTTVDHTAPVIYLLGCDTTTSVATITWTTNEAATSQIDFGLTEDYDDTTGQSADLVASHSVCLVDLKAGKTYHYRVISKDAANNEAISADMTFTTAPFGGMPRWAVVIIILAVLAMMAAVFVMIFRTSIGSESD